MCLSKLWNYGFCPELYIHVECEGLHVFEHLAALTVTTEHNCLTQIMKSLNSLAKLHVYSLQTM